MGGPDARAGETITAHRISGRSASRGFGIAVGLAAALLAGYLALEWHDAVRAPETVEARLITDRLYPGEALVFASAVAPAHRCPRVVTQVISHLTDAGGKPVRIFLTLETRDIAVSGWPRGGEPVWRTLDPALHLPVDIPPGVWRYARETQTRCSWLNSLPGVGPAVARTTDIPFIVKAK